SGGGDTVTLLTTHLLRQIPHTFQSGTESLAVIRQLIRTNFFGDIAHLISESGKLLILESGHLLDAGGNLLNSFFEIVIVTHKTFPPLFRQYLCICLYDL